MPPGSGPLTGEWRDGTDRKTGKPKRWWYSKEATPYSRTSGIAKPLDTKENLVEWAACQAAVGILLDPAARSDVATLINEYDGDPWGKGDDGTARSGKARLKSAVDKARDTAGQNVASAAGTEFHKLGELVNQGKEPRVVQEHLKPLLDKYVKAVQSVEFLRQEMFVIQDELQLAGSVDYLLRLPDGDVVVADLKTGKWDYKFPMSVTTQIAGYATSVQYNQETGERTPLHPDLNPERGVLVHFPILLPDPQVTFYELDLRRGLRAARVAREIESVRREFNRKESAPKELTW